jgi:hypothetical protein
VKPSYLQKTDLNVRSRNNGRNSVDAWAVERYLLRLVSLLGFEEVWRELLWCCGERLEICKLEGQQAQQADLEKHGLREVQRVCGRGLGRRESESLGEGKGRGTVWGYLAGSATKLEASGDEVGGALSDDSHFPKFGGRCEV